jgi:hypothetical protein
MTEVSNKSNKENEVPIRSVKSMKKNDIPTPIRNQTSFGLKRMQSSRSPFVALKQNLSNKFKNVEIENIDKIGNIVREHHSGELYKNDNRGSKDINLNNIDIKINKNQSVSTATGSEKSGTNNSEENNSNNMIKKTSSNVIKSSINKVNIPLPNSNNNITKNKIYNNKTTINNNNNSNNNNKKNFQIREGDWNCFNCNNLNFSFRIKCNRCGMLKINSMKKFNKLNFQQNTILNNNNNFNKYFYYKGINNINFINL